MNLRAIWMTALLGLMVLTGCRSGQQTTRSGQQTTRGGAQADRSEPQTSRGRPQTGRNGPQTARNDRGDALDAASLSHASNVFAFDLMRRLGTSGENQVFSPYSIHTVMGMIHEGARGKTRQEMQEVLALPAGRETGPAAGTLMKQILSADTLEGVELVLANALWLQEDFRLEDAYTTTITRYYDAEAAYQNFIPAGRREQARQEINRWVEEQTRQQIRDFLEEGVLQEYTRLVLANAIYFNGQWMAPFDPKTTSEGLFRPDKQHSVPVDFMHQTRSFPYYEDEDAQAILLPYRQETLEMLILLPRSTEGWKLLSRVLDVRSLEKMDRAFETKEVSLSLPKFRIEQGLSLEKELAAMGMPSAFSREADLSGMNGEKNLFVDKVIHKAMIEVSESGTEAAAATGAAIGLKTALVDPPVRFMADHPFFYLVRDRRSGCIIFLGRLVNPA